MILSLKSLNFAKKILKHHPLPKSHSCHQDQQQHAHQNCNHQPQQLIKPYLHVHDHRKQRQIYQKPTSQKLQNMQIFKEQGNQHFTNKRYRQAAQYYQKIIIYSDYTFPDAQKDKKLMEELVQSANCNMGIALNKFGENRKAIDNFRQGIIGPLQKITIKSTYWLVKNHIILGELQKASQLLQKLKTYGEKTTKQVLQLLNQLKTNQQAYQKSSKNLYGQMFTKQK